MSEWICPICGPALVYYDHGGPYCLRHGSQADIDADPEYAVWHTKPAATESRLRSTKGE